jgi:hypothetical protein
VVSAVRILVPMPVLEKRGQAELARILGGSLVR